MQLLNKQTAAGVKPMQRASRNARVAKSVRVDAAAATETRLVTTKSDEVRPGFDCIVISRRSLE